jgi:beta-galactosidase/beta-glucuronidase
MRGILRAADLPGWSDEEAFGDLWGEFEPLGDLPLTWRFSLDPQGTGVQNGWHEPGFDDSGWPQIEIKQFWEHQGEPYRYYDGTAWYRAAFQVPKLPPGRRLYLAFGAVNDEAAVYVDGQSAAIAEVGRQGPRFLVEVTDLLKSEKGSTIAVQVSEKGGLGGIWKNVKLIATRPKQ